MERPLLISNGRLVDGSGAAPVARADVLVHGDEILAVGTVDGVPADAVVIDATGCTVMPGLIDAHCHSTFDDVQSNDELFFHRPAPLAALPARCLGGDDDRP